MLPKAFYICLFKERSMKRYMLSLLLLILITSCAPEVEVDIAKPVEETPTKEPEEGIEVELEEPEVEENIIEIRESSFSPKEKTIEKDTEIKWIKKDKRDYKLVCYLKGTRIIQSRDLKEGDSFTYKFSEEGEYTCITVPYGLRNIITVAKTELFSPTGRAVSANIGIKGNPLTVIILMAISLLLFFYSRKKK
jgi:plastocyanin